MGKTLLDIVLGNARAEELTMEELTRGLEQNILSYDAVQALWSRSSTSGQLTVLQILRDQGREDIPSSLVKAFLESATLMKKIAVKNSLWLLTQKTITPQVASQILKKGIYRSKGLPFERFIQTSLIVKKALTRWTDDLPWLQGTISSSYEAWLTPFVAAGTPIRVCGDVHFVGLPFREDAQQVLDTMKVSASKFTSTLFHLVARQDRPGSYDHSLVSRSIDPRNALVALILGHPHLSDDVKVATLRLADQKLISLDNLIQLKVIPKELLFGDLRELCAISSHYVKQFHNLQKGGST
jgi:hypothetical protein